MWRHIGYEMFRKKEERKKGNVKKKGCGENVKPANIPRKYVATVWLNLFSYAVAIFFPVCRDG